MKPRILLRKTRWGMRYVCNDGVFTGIGTSLMGAYRDWEEQAVGAEDFAMNVHLNGLPEQYREFGRKQYNKSEIQQCIEFTVWEMQNE